jgi:hypothetical protein
MATSEPDAGAPVPRDKVDPDLVKLERTKSRVGVITSLGVVILCIAFLFRLSSDRSFAGASDEAEAVAVGDILAGKVGDDKLVEVEAEPIFAHGIRTVKTKGDLGARLVPVRGTNDRLWLALQGDPYDPPNTTGRYRGRLRKLADVNFGKAMFGYTAEHPRPVFAAPSEIRAAFASGTIKSVAGDAVQVTDDDRVMFELAEPSRAILVVSISRLRPNARGWKVALEDAGITPVTELPARDVDTALQQIRFEANQPPAEIQQKLHAGDFFGVRIDGVTTHYTTTWGELKKSPPTGFTALVDGKPGASATVADAQVDLLGVYARHQIPGDAYALLTSEHPEDYWYVLPITVILVGLGLMFAWAFVRAVRRDLLPVRA